MKGPPARQTGGAGSNSSSNGRADTPSISRISPQFNHFLTQSHPVPSCGTGSDSFSADPVPEHKCTNSGLSCCFPSQIVPKTVPPSPQSHPVPPSPESLGLQSRVVFPLGETRDWDWVRFLTDLGLGQQTRPAVPPCASLSPANPWTLPPAHHAPTGLVASIRNTP